MELSIGLWPSDNMKVISTFSALNSGDCVPFLYCIDSFLIDSFYILYNRAN